MSRSMSSFVSCRVRSLSSRCSRTLRGRARQSMRSMVSREIPLPDLARDLDGAADGNRLRGVGLKDVLRLKNVDIGVACEIVRVEGEQVVYTVHTHGGHQPGIIHINAGNRVSDH